MLRTCRRAAIGRPPHALRCLPCRTAFTAFTASPRPPPLTPPLRLASSSSRAAAVVPRNSRTSPIPRLPHYDAVQDDAVGRALRKRQAELEEMEIKVSKRVRRPAAVRALKRLNEALAAAKKNRDDVANRAVIWKAYCQAKDLTPNLLPNVPDPAWDLIWYSQSFDAVENTDAKARQEQILKDMQSVGKEAPLHLRLEHLEKTFTHGEREKAIQSWEEEHDPASTAAVHGHKVEHLALGVRMHALHGNSARAHTILDELYDRDPTWEPRLMFDVMNAHVRANTDEDLEQAWTLYTRYKERLGDSMTLDDFDTAYATFLDSQETGCAVAVFKDMVERKLLAPHFEREEVRKVVRRLKAMFFLSPTTEAVNKVALTALSCLPVPYHGSLYKDWLRHLVHLKEPAVASQAVELMYERGFRPRTWHFDLLVGCLLTAYPREAVERGVSLAWAMIDRAQEAASAPDGQIQLRPHTYHRPIPPHLERRIPAASPNTFAHLIRHYANNYDWHRVEEVQTILRDLSPHPSTLLMNALLHVDLKRGNYAAVYRRYHALTHPPPGTDIEPVRPNGATFWALWRAVRDGLAAHESRPLDHPPIFGLEDDLPHPRALMRHMLTWWRDSFPATTPSPSSSSSSSSSSSAQSHQTPTYRRQALRGLRGQTRDVPGFIAGCFRLAHDLPGALVALRLLGRHLALRPTGRAVDSVLRQLSWVDLRDPRHERLRGDGISGTGPGGAGAGAGAAGWNKSPLAGEMFMRNLGGVRRAWAHVVRERFDRRPAAWRARAVVRLEDALEQIGHDDGVAEGVANGAEGANSAEGANRADHGNGGAAAAGGDVEAGAFWMECLEVFVRAWLGRGVHADPRAVEYLLAEVEREMSPAPSLAGKKGEGQREREEGEVEEEGFG